MLLDGGVVASDSHDQLYPTDGDPLPDTCGQGEELPGRSIRKYSGSSRPPGICPEQWQLMSKRRNSQQLGNIKLLSRQPTGFAVAAAAPATAGPPPTNENRSCNDDGVPATAGPRDTAAGDSRAPVSVSPNSLLVNDKSDTCDSKVGSDKSDACDSKAGEDKLDACDSKVEHDHKIEKRARSREDVQAAVSAAQKRQDKSHTSGCKKRSDTCQGRNLARVHPHRIHPTRTAWKHAPWHRR